ncbi:MAG: zinc metallopeptidase [Firmicutes bacterium]|nr:zinc metallopeptidase [Bacillota bacterium]
MNGFLILIPAIIFTFIAQSKVQSAYSKYSKIYSRSSYSGAEAARELLSRAGLNVPINQISGKLGDNYDPVSKTLRLSRDTYSSGSIAAIAIAAHEAGHALQDAEDYPFLKLRSAFVPLANIGSQAAMPFIIIGLLISAYYGHEIGYNIALAGIVLFALAVIFYLITLPVEFNASSRALDLLEGTGILNSEELPMAKKVLSAAAMTYVASAATALAQLLRLLLMVSGGRRRD